MPTERVIVFHPTSAEPMSHAIRSAVAGIDVVPVTSADDVGAELASATVLCTQSSLSPTTLRAAGANLRWIQVLAAGVERWVGSIPPNARLTRVTGTFGPRMAEYVVGYVFAVNQRMREVFEQQSERRWNPLELGVVGGSTMVVVGLGSIGASVVRLCQAVGMRTVGVSRTRPSPDLGLDEWYPVDRLADAVGEARYITVVTPLTAQTRGIISAAVIAAVKEDAWIINIGRGDLVDEDPLVAALRDRRIGGAVLDVFSEEPLPAAHELWGMDNVLLTPHHSGSTLPSEAVDTFVDNLRRYLAGQPLVNEVDLGRGY